MKKVKKVLALISFLLSAFFAIAQTDLSDSFEVALNKYKFMPGDTLSMAAGIKTGGKPFPPSTLQIVIEHEGGKSMKLRWPILQGYATGDLALPDSLPQGKYTVTFALQPKFFRIYGKVLEPNKLTELSTMLLTGKGEWLMQDIPIEPDGAFVIKGWLFEKDATLVFNRKKKSGSDLDIKIDTWLDSTYKPTALAVREFYLGTPPTAIKIDSTGKNTKADISKFSETVNALPEVIVRGKLKSKADKFNEEYSTGMFHSMNEKVFDFMDDPTASSYPSVLDYLQGRVAGLQINRTGGDVTATWRRDAVSFYIDELRVEPEQINNLSTADIAIVKVYPPPFFGNTGGNGGAIAIYTRRGGYYDQTTNRHIFKIKGYSPLQTALDLNSRQ